MSRKALILTIVLTILALSRSWSQECNCQSHLQWVIDTFGNNDAGFSYVLDKKGEGAYKELVENSLAQSTKALSQEACRKLIRDWLFFFRKGHHGVQYLQDGEGTGEISEEAIRERFRNEETFPIHPEHLMEYLQKQGSPKSLEGIWEWGDYRVGVIGIEDGGTVEYIGSILKADGVWWSPGQVKFRINSDGAGGYGGTFHLRDHSPQPLETVTLYGGNYLQTNSVIWERKYPSYPEDPVIRDYVTHTEANEPLLQELSEHTLYLRIPSFGIQHKVILDSILKENHNQIITRQNLLIDIRGNGGGSDATYQELLKYLYTNPISLTHAAMRSTPLNNKKMERFLEGDQWPEEIRVWAKEGLEKLQAAPGEFININEADTEEIVLDQVYPYPANIAILIDGEVASSAEQFLLAARQSLKVKLFGQATAGILDMANVNQATSTCGHLRLWYAVSRSLRLPDHEIDGHGIQPDFNLQKNFPVYLWVSHVTDLLKKQAPETRKP